MFSGAFILASLNMYGDQTDYDSMYKVDYMPGMQQALSLIYLLYSQLPQCNPGGFSVSPDKHLYWIEGFLFGGKIGFIIRLLSDGNLRSFLLFPLYFLSCCSDCLYLTWLWHSGRCAQHTQLQWTRDCGPEMVDFIVELGDHSYFIAGAALACGTTI